jgi:hypothetical protein
MTRRERLAGDAVPTWNCKSGVKKALDNPGVADLDSKT